MSYAARGGKNNFRMPPSAKIKPTRLRSGADERLAPEPGRFMKAGSHGYCLSEAGARCKLLHSVSARIDASRPGVDPERQFVATHLNATNRRRASVADREPELCKCAGKRALPVGAESAQRGLSAEPEKPS